MAHEMFLAEDFFDRGNGIYETIVAIARRSRQIAEEHRKEMDAYLTQVGMLEDFQDEEESPLDELILMHSEPVLQFEKPSVLALREMISDKLELHRPEEKVEEEVEVVEPGMEMPGKLDLSGLDGDSEKKPADDLPTSFPSTLSLDE